MGEPDDRQREIYELLLGIQLAGLAAVAAGVAARDVDATCRTMVADAGYADWYLHSVGHGVGLLIERAGEQQTHADSLGQSLSAVEHRTPRGSQLGAAGCGQGPPHAPQQLLAEGATPLELVRSDWL